MFWAAYESDYVPAVNHRIIINLCITIYNLNWWIIAYELWHFFLRRPIMDECCMCNIHTPLILISFDILLWEKNVADLCRLLYLIFRIIDLGIPVHRSNAHTYKHSHSNVIIVVQWYRRETANSKFAIFWMQHKIRSILLNVGNGDVWVCIICSG